MVVVLSASCGAGTELDSRPLPRSSPASKPATTPSPAPPPDTKPAKPGGDGNDDGLDLGQGGELDACRPGTSPGTGQPCPFIAASVCYPDANSACACICARDRDTTCAEGLFPNAEGAIEVNCYAL